MAPIGFPEPGVAVGVNFQFRVLFFSFNFWRASFSKLRCLLIAVIVAVTPRRFQLQSGELKLWRGLSLRDF